MMRVLGSLLLLAALGGGGMLAGAVLRTWSGDVEAEADASPVGRVAGEAGMGLGPATGVPVLHVFGDYECPACFSLEREAGDSLRALAEKGAIRFVYHHAPLRAHLRGPRAAAAAYCAADAGAGWAAHAALYASAPEWGTGADGEERVIRALAPLVPDPVALRACVRDDLTERRVDADRRAADALGVRAVPAIFLGDHRLRVGSWRGLVRYVSAIARAP